MTPNVRQDSVSPTRKITLHTNSLISSVACLSVCPSVSVLPDLDMGPTPYLTPLPKVFMKDVLVRLRKQLVQLNYLEPCHVVVQHGCDSKD